MFSSFYVFLILAWQMQTMFCQEMCDCSKITLLQKIVQQITWDQKVQSTKLAELEAWRMTNHVSPETQNNDFVNRHISMEKQMVDVNVKLEKLVKLEGNTDKVNMDDIIRKTITSEKLERLDFVSDVKTQMTEMMGTIQNFKNEMNKTLDKKFKVIDAAEENMMTGIDEKLKNMKDTTEKFMDTAVTNVTLEIAENMEQFTHLSMNIVEVKKHVEDIQEIAVNEKVDGKWSDWSTWSSCSVSCGSGIKHRERICSNPPPSELGKQCEGNNWQINSCAPERCSDKVVAFHAYGIAAGSTASDVPTFPYVVINQGNDYDKTSGIFNCGISGIYYFSFTLSIRKDAFSLSKQCYLTINSTKKTVRNIC